MSLLSGVICPVATQDITINLKNRNNAFKKFGYGPPNPDEPNELFWLKNIGAKAARKMLMKLTPGQKVVC